MKAIRVHATGGPEALIYEEVPDPVPGKGEVLIEIDAAGVNFFDVYQRTGLYPVPLPAILGQEAGGRIVEVGAEAADVVPGIVPGDAVAYQGVQGSYAELAVVPAESVVLLPSSIDRKQGAAAMIQGMTAHYLACATFPLKRGDTCLVHAAAGGVGLLLCQIAKLRGARVIGTVSTGEKANLARQAGADEIILYNDQDFETETRRLTEGAGVQVVYDSVGRTTFEKSLRCLAPRGTMVSFGQSSGRVPPFDVLMLSRLGSLYLTRPTLQYYARTRQEMLERANEVFGWIRDGSLTLRIGREFPLSQAAEAHRELEARATTGKVLLIPER